MGSMAPSAKLRVIQLKESMDFITSNQQGNRAHHMMIMGDFNCCATLNKKALPITDEQFIDAWTGHYDKNGKYEQANPGWTMPENDYYPSWRPDRMYYSFNYDYTKNENENDEEKKEDVAVENKKSEWCLKGIKRIGMDNIPFEEEENVDKRKAFDVLAPSDHYGLLAEFVCKTDQSRKNKKSNNCVLL